MSVILTYGARKPVVRIGRIAGQYAKPRSQATENINGINMTTYRGDAINGHAPNAQNRTPDPQRLLQAYQHSAITLNYIRSAIAGGLADLHHPQKWDLYSIEKSPRWQDYQQWVHSILDAIDFLDAVDATRSESLNRVDFFTSHEGLLLEYESAFTKKDPDSGNYYNLSAHTLWIGDRTRDLDSAHIEYFRGIANPIGLKVGPSMDEEQLIQLITKLDPKNQPGRITLITRLGSNRVPDLLPKFIKAIQKQKLKVIWSVDPMHGNIETTQSGIKTRNFEKILHELDESFHIHTSMQSYLGGIHFELTGDNVTECTGGAIGLLEQDLDTNYETFCDPRLNYSQSLEMAFLIAKLLKN